MTYDDIRKSWDKARAAFKSNDPNWLYEHNREEYERLKQEMIKESKLYTPEKDTRLEYNDYE